jgi:hypothetical protein
MSASQGQATVEWAGLLALAAVLGSALALIAGPPLVHAVQSALASALGGRPSARRAPLVASAADIADVQSALTGAASQITPDAALLALGRRHAIADADELADRILLATALRHAPSLGAPVTRRLYPDVDHRVAGRTPEGNSDRDVETPTGAPSATWVTTVAQRDALAGALAHHTRKLDVAMGLASFIPILGAHRTTEVGASGVRLALRFIARHGQDTYEQAQAGVALADSLQSSDEGVPGGMLAGDVVVSWRAHVTAWRDGAATRESASSNYTHIVYLRPIGGELAIVGEGREP